MREPAGPLVLAAGRWSAVLDGTVVHSVRAGATEVAQRVYVAVRDADWNSVPGRVVAIRSSRRADAVEATLEVRHQSGTIDFAWQGTISLDPEQGFQFRFAGRADTTFEYAKVGLNVHHPLETTIGRRLRARTPSGWIERSVSPEIAPQAFEDGRFSAMFPEYDVLEIEVDQGAWATFRFAGDLWEMQDHRNWTDANFKSYLSLAKPAPALMQAGELIVQSIDIQVDPALAAERGRRVERSAREEVVVTDRPAPPLPQIGVELEDGTLGPESLAPEARALARLQYLRVPLHLSRASWREDLDRAAVWTASLDVPAELALFVPPAGTAQLEALDRALARLRLPVVRFAVFDEGAELDGRSGATSIETFLAARGRMTTLTPVPCGIGTERSFAELNRRPPDPSQASFVTFNVNPQVHVSDDRALFENAAAQRTVVTEARRVSGGLPVVVGNVALIGRHGPFPDGPVRSDGRSANADPRIEDPLAAAWTLASIEAIADGAAIAATWFEVSGDRGIVGPSPRPPLWVLRAAAACAGQTRLRVRAPSDVAVLAFESEGGRNLLVANLTPVARELRLAGIPGATATHSRLSSPELINSVQVRGGRALVSLDPFDVVRLQAGVARQ